MKKLLMICCWATLLLTGCGEPKNRAKGVYMLLDTSGTYALELKKAQNILNYLLGTLQPGDSLVVTVRCEGTTEGHQDCDLLYVHPNRICGHLLFFCLCLIVSRGYFRYSQSDVSPPLNDFLRYL